MPTKIDFYLLENQAPTAVAKTVCLLCEKAYQVSQSVYIHCDSETQVRDIDTLLWLYKDTSFIPHETAPNAVLVPASLKYDILLNITAKIPGSTEFLAQFDRIIEVVSASDQDKHAARDRFRFYRQTICEPNSHRLSS